MKPSELIEILKNFDDTYEICISYDSFCGGSLLEKEDIIILEFSDGIKSLNICSDMREDINYFIKNPTEFFDNKARIKKI